MRLGFALVITLLLISVAFPALAKETHVVKVTADSFTPKELAVAVGDVVRWEWESGANTITNGDSPIDELAGTVFDISINSENPVYEHTFDREGTVVYFSRPHFETMTGTITVTLATPVTQKTWGWLKRTFEGGATSGLLN